MLRARQLTRSFGGRTAVAGVDLDIQRGEVVGFLGLNGAGKTTTLRMLCGTLVPDSGTVEINGLDIRQQPQAARAQIGYLPDTPPLYAELTVLEFLDYCARLRGMRPDAIAAACARVVDATDLGEQANTRCGALSRGFRQRVGIAQAIVHQPALVVLDEPTSGLDPRQIEDIRALVRALAADASVLLSSHNLTEVCAVCSRSVIIHHGEMVFNGDTHENSRESLENSFFDITGARPQASAGTPGSAS